MDGGGFSLRPDLGQQAATRVASVLQRGIDDGRFLGAQAYVSLHGAPVVDLALGDARVDMPMTTDTLVSWQCNTKPVTAAAVCLLWERGLLDLDAPVAEYVSDFERHGKGAITVRHLLGHTAAFADDPPYATIGALNLDQMERLACEARPEDGWVPGSSAIYSTWYGFAALGVIVSRVSGRPFPSFVREEIFEPLGMDDCWIGVDPSHVDGVADRLGFLYEMRDGRPEVPPIAAVLQGKGLEGCSPASGGIGSMRRLGRFYESMLDAARGGSGLLAQETVRAMLDSHRPWGLGFMVLPGHFGIWCPRAFGHDGLRSSLVFADPDRGLVVAAFVNSLGVGQSNIELLLDVSRAVYLSVLTPAELREVGLVVHAP